ncbi:hypothetical protein LSM04_006486 [Trypanosoma melophagium]|uniref:uncharacterized protein n=1 Tax=Trypanosoma melophagium TaxID=715481 RepID=UPI00351A7D0D|nr:hypothetical protein LSM04_006486 [Trypanosoma melophagium]
MDPSKRICLKNIPPDCTKREIAEFIRNRTGAQPHSIDLGLTDDGRPRRYAHFSAEGAKNIFPVLTGAVWRGCTITALQATPHYSYRLAEARRKQQERERAEAAQRTAYLKYCTEKWLAKTGGELTAGRAPKSFYATRQRYAAVAAEIARKLREEHKSKQWNSNGQTGGNCNYHHREEEEQEKEENVRLSTTENADWNEGRRPRMAENTKSNQHYKHPRGKGVFSAKGAKKPRTESNGSNTNTTTAEKKDEEKPPAPSKEERKLSGLQAKLAALRAKMK